MGLHRCADAECPSAGQATTKSCLCHRTDEQVLTEQRDELLEALKECHRALMHYEWYANPASGWAAPDQKFVRHMTDAAIAKAEGRS